MKRLNYIISSLMLAMGGMTAFAQQNASGYFLDNYLYRFQSNPAFDSNNRFFVTMPVMGNTRIGFNGSLHFNDLLYSVNGKTALFTHPDISSEQVMSRFEKDNTLETNLKMTLLGAGFKAFGGYNTVTINAVADVRMNVPKSFFMLMREGISNQTYDIGNMQAQALGYGEIALGHSHKVRLLKGLRVGGSLKFLMGFANMEALFKKTQLALNEDSWNATVQADLYSNVPKMQLEQKYNKNTNSYYVSGMNMDGTGGFKPNGFGMAVDLGASYEWCGFTFSAALLDLGFINFKNTLHASTNGERTFQTDAYTFDLDKNFDDTFDQMADDLERLYQLDDNGNIGSRSRKLASTMNLGVSYALPFYKRLNVGALYTQHFNGDYSWKEFRLSANAAPFKWLGAGINMGTGSYGTSFGWILNLKSFAGLFVSMDYMPKELAKQGLPLTSQMAMNMGINFAW